MCACGGNKCRKVVHVWCACGGGDKCRKVKCTCGACVVCVWCACGAGDKCRKVKCACGGGDKCRKVKCTCGARVVVGISAERSSAHVVVVMGTIDLVGDNREFEVLTIF